MNSTTQSTLARLLSKENITVQHGNYSTAFFDVEQRVLGLPMWKEKSKDVYDLLVGHEVGHALFTPRDFHHNCRGARHDYINLVEDVRIERKVQAQYPGLIGCFTRGYSSLSEEDFFGINHKDVNALGLADRLNLKFKLRNLIDIKFSAVELVIYRQIERAETWDEVVTAALDLEKFIKAQQQKQAEQKQAEDSEPDSTGNSVSKQTDAEDDTKSGEPDDASDGVKSEAEAKTDEPEKADSSNDAEANQDSLDSKSEKASSDVTNDAPADPTQNAIPNQNSDDVTTQRAFDDNASKRLIDDSKETLMTSFAATPTTAECFENILPFPQLNKLRLSNPAYAELVRFPLCQTAFQQFLKSTRKAVGLLAKEFELRKAAYQYSRATVSKTGSLNLSKLHAYKISEDLFLSVSQLANAKNHGMVMFVDYSGSMLRQLPHVLKHLINMALFCRQVGIPFAVYGFTSDNGLADLTKARGSRSVDRVILSRTILLELVSSDLSKNDFNTAIYALYMRASYNHCAALCEQLGNTPLNETLIIAHDIVKQFRAKHNPDKMTTIFLTDGDGGTLQVSKSTAIDQHRTVTQCAIATAWSFWQQSISFKLNGRNVIAKPPTMTSELIRNLRITTGTEVIGFFIPGNRKQLRDAITNAIFFGSLTVPDKCERVDKCERAYKDDQVVSIPGAYHYSNYFIVASGDDLAVDDEELEVTADMSRNRMARAFMNYSSSKKSNRVFVTKFAEALA